MGNDAPAAGRGKKWLFAILLLTMVAAAIEGLSLLAYRSITGQSYSADSLPVAAVPESLDVKPGREKAGLGFKDPNMSLHPFLGYVYTPPAPGDEPRRVSVSPDGFLDTAPAVRQRDPAKLIVAILGGSVAGQLGTWHSPRLIDALAAVPAYAGRDIDLVRLGMPGYHQPQQVIQLSYLLAQGGEFDVVLNIDGFNEVAVPGALNAPQGAHPLFPMNWSMVALDVPDPEVRRHVGAIEYLQAERGRREAQFRDSLRSRSVLGKLLWKRQDRYLEEQIARHAWSLQEYPLEEIPYFVRGPEAAHDPPEGMVPWCVAVWKRSSLQLQALCAANDIRYLHILQPNQYVPGSKPLSAEESENAFDAEGPYKPVVEEGYPLLSQAGEELRTAGVEFHDFTDLFKQSRETLYVDNCCHFNGDGNQLLCEAIATALGAS